MRTFAAHRFVPHLLVFALAATLAGCGTGAVPGGGGPGDDDPPTGGDPEPYWEMTVTSGDDEPFVVTGASVVFVSPTVIVLGDSTPVGWDVGFTITGDLPIGIPYFTDNDDLLNATVGTPTGTDCVATPTTNFALPSFVTLAPPEGAVPVGTGSVFVDGGCGGFAAETLFEVGFGVQ